MPLPRHEQRPQAFALPRKGLVAASRARTWGFCLSGRLETVADKRCRADTTNDTSASVGVVPRARRGVWSRATVKQPARIRKSLGYLNATERLREA